MTKLLEKIKKYQEELDILKKKLTTNYIYTTKNEIKNFFNNNEELIKIYEINKAYLTKEIHKITMRLKYCTNDEFRNNQLKYKECIRKKNKNIDNNKIDLNVVIDILKLKENIIENEKKLIKILNDNNLTNKYYIHNFVLDEIVI